MKKFLLAMLLVLLSCGAALAIPQALTIETNDLKLVRDTIVIIMTDDGFTMTESDEYRLVFEKSRENDFASMFLLGSSWNMVPNSRVTFNAISTSEGIKTSCDGVIVTNPGTGFERIHQAENKRFVNEKRAMLYKIKADVEGLDFDTLIKEAGIDLGNKKKAEPEPEPVKSSGLTFDGLTVKSVEPDSIADKAGLRADDVVVEVNLRAADEETLKDIDTRLAAGRSVVITYEREGQKDIATLK